MYSVLSDWALPQTGFPIRKSPDQSLFDGSPKLIAAFHVLLRLLTPRHPPIALNILFYCKSLYLSVNAQLDPHLDPGLKLVLSFRF